MMAKPRRRLRWPLTFGMGLLCALVVSAPRSGRSSGPTVWERAADPMSAPLEHVHRSVQTLLAEAESLRLYTPMAQERLAMALRQLEGAAADKSPDVRLRFDLGRILSLLGEEERARDA